jgi:hypothetical protein
LGDAGGAGSGPLFNGGRLVFAGGGPVFAAGGLVFAGAGGLVFGDDPGVLFAGPPEVPPPTDGVPAITPGGIAIPPLRAMTPVFLPPPCVLFGGGGGGTDP